jgi:hypothetical protein
MSQCFVAKVVVCYVSTIERQWDKYRVEIVAPKTADTEFSVWNL